ncbi:hypothetical protein ACHAPT_008847 [Fusarium lateritium]
MMPKINSSLRALALMTMLFSQTMAMYLKFKPSNNTARHFGEKNITQLTSIPQLEVFLWETAMDPLTMTVFVTNKNNATVTINTWNSPLDPLAIKKKILKSRRRYWWPITNLPIYGPQPDFTSPCEVHKTIDPKDLLEIPAGGMVARDHVFDKESGWDTSKRHVRGRLRRSTGQMVGMWRGVWLKTKEEVMKLPARDDNYDQCNWFTSNLFKFLL